MEQKPESEESSPEKSSSNSNVSETVISNSQNHKDIKCESEKLGDLLDSCLDDFAQKPVLTNKPKSQPSVPTATAASSSGCSTDFPNAATWTDEFKQFNKMMENYMDDEGEIKDMKQWMESLSSGQNLPAADDDFAKSFADALKEMTEQAQNIPDANPDELASLLGGLDLDPGAAEQLSDVMPLMQNVMQKLMSKELLYPSIKEISEKYPDWLREKQSSLSTQDYNNYKTQHELMVKVCEEFEKSTDGSDAANKEQFENVLQLMQKIQNYGNPPKELVSNTGPGIPFDEQGNLQIPGMPQQCSIM